MGGANAFEVAVSSVPLVTDPCWMSNERSQRPRTLPQRNPNVPPATARNCDRSRRSSDWGNGHVGWRRTPGMKNVDDLIEEAAELSGRGFSRGEIADELNVSRETASWLVERSGAAQAADAGGPAIPDDIHVDWSALGRDSARLSYVGRAMADLLSKQGEAVDLTVGIENAGVPLATVVADELDTDIAAYAPSKHQWESEGDTGDQRGSFSRNFADIRDRECYVVDDTITSGTTMTETVEAITERGGDPVACVVLVDKNGVDAIDGIPVYSLIRAIRVGDA